MFTTKLEDFSLKPVFFYHFFWILNEFVRCLIALSVSYTHIDVGYYNEIILFVKTFLTFLYSGYQLAF